MPVYRNALRAMARNYRLAALYLGSVLLVTTTFHGYNGWAKSVIGEGTMPAWLECVGLLADVAYAAGLAMAQAAVFSMLGAEIDRPLWKCAGLAEALRRYFLPWFILGLLSLALFRIFVDRLVAEAYSTAELINFFRLLLYMVAMPVGACVMFHRGLEWSLLGKILSPISRRIGLIIGVLFIGFFQWTAELAAVAELSEQLSESGWVLAAINTPMALLECYAFIAMWHICMVDRDEMLNAEPDDYDF